MRFLLIILLFLSGIIAGTAQPCPNYGDATVPDKKDLNINKNQSVTVKSSRKPEMLPLKNLLPSVQRSDKGIYMTGAYVVTEGILVRFEEQEGESCNCEQATKKKKDGDVHMYIGTKANAPIKECIVVELTPAYKKKHPAYANSLVKNAKVRITGFLLYDFIHEKDAFTTCKSCSGIWRKTCWEIHPITKIELL